MLVYHDNILLIEELRLKHANNRNLVKSYSRKLMVTVKLCSIVYMYDPQYSLNIPKYALFPGWWWWWFHRWWSSQCNIWSWKIPQKWRRALFDPWPKQPVLFTCTFMRMKFLMLNTVLHMINCLCVLPINHYFHETYWIWVKHGRHAFSHIRRLLIYWFSLSYWRLSAWHTFLANVDNLRHCPVLFPRA